MTGIARHQGFDSDELADALVGWSQAYTQVGRGRLQAELLHLMLPDASLIYERSNLHMHENMVPPQDQIVVALPLDIASEPLCNARPLALDSLLLLRGGEEVEICAPEEFRTIALCLNRRLLTEALGEQDQERFERALDDRLLPLPQDTARDVRATLFSVLSVFERGNWKASDPGHARGATVVALGQIMQAINEAQFNANDEAKDLPRSLR